MANDDKPWFQPKRYGYGAGFPVAWQGWAAIGLYIAGMLLAGAVLMPQSPGGFAAAVLVLSAGLILVARRNTRSGWRWRWGEDD